MHVYSLYVTYSYYLSSFNIVYIFQLCPSIFKFWLRHWPRPCNNLTKLQQGCYKLVISVWAACAVIYLALSWLYKDKVKGLLQLEKVMVYAKAYYFFNSKCDNFHLFIVRGQFLANY